MAEAWELRRMTICSLGARRGGEGGPDRMWSCANDAAQSDPRNSGIHG